MMFSVGSDRKKFNIGSRMLSRTKQRSICTRNDVLILENVFVNIVLIH